MIPVAYGVWRCLHKGLVVLLFDTVAAHAEPVTLLALGDSLTAGYGLAQEDGFVPQLEARFIAQGQDVRVINAGVSGDTSAGGASRLGWILTDDIDAVIVTLGGNDMLRGIPPEETHANLQKILSELSTKDLPVLLVGISSSANFGPDYKTAFEQIFPDLSNEFQVPLFPDFLSALSEGETAASTRMKYLQSDGLHPNPEGVLRIVSAMETAVMDLIKATETN